MVYGGFDMKNILVAQTVKWTIIIVATKLARRAIERST